jgi:hypothetical protein
MEAVYKRCTKCGEAKPATAEYFSRDSKQKSGLSPRCKTCNRAAGAAYYAANKEKVKARHSAYKAENKEQIKVQNAAYRAAHKDEAKAYGAAYDVANRDKVNARKRAYRAKNINKVRTYACAWINANPDKRRMYSRTYNTRHPEKARNKVQRREAAKRLLPASFADDDWLRALDYWQCQCAYCGRPQGLWHKLSQDHYVPITLGGSYTAGNIVPACNGRGGCNNSKSNRDAHEWLVSKFGARKANQIERRIRQYFEWTANQQAR